jgi:putative exporter of polyketide antibiotics
MLRGYDFHTCYSLITKFKRLIALPPIDWLVFITIKSHVISFIDRIRKLRWKLLFLFILIPNGPRLHLKERIANLSFFAV